jgi:microcystin-dependent protein
MPTYVEILDSEISAENPVTVSLMTRMRDNALAYMGAPTGTRAPFQQTAAPLGWTKETSSTYDEAAPRVVTGSVGTGGSVDFSTVFARTATDAHTLSESEMPTHTHSVSNNTTSHTHSEVAMVQNGPAASGTGTATWAPVGQQTGTQSANHTHILGDAGSGGSHSHNIDLRVKYVDHIIATKD